MTTQAAPDGMRPAAIDCRAPKHDRGSRRLLLAPGAVSTGDGSDGRAVVLLRLGRLDGSVDSLFRGTSLHGATEVAKGAIRDRDPDAVWITDRRYFRRNWSPWTLRAAEARLAEAADRAGAALVAWTGDRRDAGPGDYGDA